MTGHGQRVQQGDRDQIINIDGRQASGMQPRTLPLNSGGHGLRHQSQHVFRQQARNSPTGRRLRGDGGQIRQSGMQDRHRILLGMVQPTMRREQMMGIRPEGTISPPCPPSRQASSRAWWDI
ncbi:hypothetical protein GCM10017784_37130 [Deinococcus indicus]|nr:hypothetical protein GCM10017784_37130 [Deinococcus indicus]